MNEGNQLGAFTLALVGKLKLSCEVIVVNRFSHKVVAFE